MATTTKTARTVRQRNIEWFANHAGYATPPGRMACAKSLADAEEIAENRGWFVVWESDDDGELGDHAYWCDGERKGQCPGHRVECALLCETDRDTGADNVLSSLGSVIDADADYRRVIAAELADEARF